MRKRRSRRRREVEEEEKEKGKEKGRGKKEARGYHGSSRVRRRLDEARLSPSSIPRPREIRITF